MRKLTGIILSVILVFSVFGIASADAASPMIAAGYDHSIALSAYGRVHAYGSNNYGQCRTYSWKNVASVAAGKFFSAALFSDNTVKTTDPSFVVDSWQDIVKIAAGDRFLAGLRSDGTVLITGDNPPDVSAWSSISDIAAGKTHILALRADGTCVAAGNFATNVSSWSGISKIFAGATLSVGMQENGNLVYSGNPTYYMMTVPGEDTQYSGWLGSSWTDVKDMTILSGFSNNSIVIAVKNDGTVVTDWHDKDNPPTGISDLKNVRQISANSNGSVAQVLVLYEDNSVSTLGSLGTAYPLWSSTVSSWQLEREPLTFNTPFPLFAAGKNSLTILKPDGGYHTFGDEILPDVPDIKYADLSDYSTNVYAYIDEDEKIHASFAYDFTEWDGAQKISVTSWNASTEKLISALRWDGNLLSSDGTQYSNVVDLASTTLSTSVLFRDGRLYDGTSYYYDVVSFDAGANHFAALKFDGTCIAFGNRNTQHELDVSDWSDLVGVSAGCNFTVGLKSDGTCVATGLNRAGQCNVSEWRDVTYIFAGYDYTIGYTNDGHFLFAGSDANKIKDVENYVLTDTSFERETVRFNYSFEGGVHTFEFKQDGTFDSLSAFVVFYNTDGRITNTYTQSVSPNAVITAYDSAYSWRVLVWDDMRPVFSRVSEDG